MPLFSGLAQQPDIAKVNKILGLYVFTDSEALPHPDESLPACVDVLCQRNFAFLAQLERWPAGQLLDYVSRQIGALIRAKQLEWLSSNWPNLASLRCEDLDINRLHNLYARLQTLHRPSQSQLNRLYAVKALLLEYNYEIGRASCRERV